MKLTKTVFSYFFILLWIILFDVPYVFGQSLTLSISPPTVQAVIKPGKSILIAYTVQNNADPTTLRTYVVPFEAEGINGRISIKNRFDGPIRFSLDNDTVKLNEPVFIKSGESKQFLLKIYVPEKTPQGDYYYSFLAETFAPKSIEGSVSTQSRVSIGSTILITVSNDGLTEIKGSIKQFSFKPLFSLKMIKKTFHIVESSSPIPIVLVVGNESANYTTMGGTISLTGMFGERISYSLLPLTVLKNSERKAKTNFSNVPECLIEQPPLYCSDVSTIFKGFFIGKYKINATVYLGDQTQFMYANAELIALPIKLMMGIVIALFMFWIIIKKYKGT